MQDKKNVMGGNFDLNSIGNHKKFIGYSALYFAIAYIVMQAIMQYEMWFFGAGLFFWVWVMLIGIYITTIILLYILKSKIAVNANSFTKNALHISLLLSIIVALSLMI